MPIYNKQLICTPFVANRQQHSQHYSMFRP